MELAVARSAPLRRRRRRRRRWRRNGKRLTQRRTRASGEVETPVSSRPLARWSTSASRLNVIIIPVVFIRTRLYCCRYDCLACITTALLYSIKIRVHRTLLFVFLLGYNTTHCPLGIPTRQSTIHSLGSARTRARGLVHACAWARARVRVGACTRAHASSPISR